MRIPKVRKKSKRRTRTNLVEGFLGADNDQTSSCEEELYETEQTNNARQ